MRLGRLSTTVKALVKGNLVDAAVGGAGAAAGLVGYGYAFDTIQKYIVAPVPEAVQKYVHPTARLALAAALPMLLGRYARTRHTRNALFGASIGLGAAGVVSLVNAAMPGTFPAQSLEGFGDVLGLSGADVLVESRALAGADVFVEGPGGQSGYASVLQSGHGM